MFKILITTKFVGYGNMNPYGGVSTTVVEFDSVEEARLVADKINRDQTRHGGVVRYVDLLF